MRVGFILLMFVSYTSIGDVLPDDRKPLTNSLPWSSAGLGSAIPTFTNGCNLVTDYGADNTGVSDCTTAFTSAIAGCPAYSAIFIPAGSYRINSALNITKNNIVMRGAGPGATVLYPYSSAARMFFWQASGINASNSISSGYTRGSTNLTLATTTSIVQGSYCLILESNSPTICIGNIATANDHGQVVQVQSVSGNNITIAPPIYIGFTASCNPGIQSFSSPVTNSGMESLTIDMANSTAQDAVSWRRCAYCWMTNVVVTNVSNVGIELMSSAHCTIQYCKSGWTKSEASSTYGFQLQDRSSDNLVTDCISERISSGYICHVGASGNVVSYSFHGLSYTNGNCLESNYRLHGDLPNFNLFEGNIGSEGQIDNTWGANLLNTYYRNWFNANPLGTNYPTNCKLALQLSNQDYTNSWIGNVLMLPIDTGVTPTGSHAPYSIDADSAPSLFMHGNFDFMSNATQWSNSVSQTLPSSYYLSGKPAWFGNLAWPPIGPDISTNSAITNNILIPAQARYLGVVFPYTNFATVQFNGTISLSGSASFK